MKHRIHLKLYYIYIEHEVVQFQTSYRGKPFTNQWLEITEDGKMTIFGTNQDGYAWDGCSPKWIWRDLVWGTPDGRLHYHKDRDRYKPITYYASMLHDVLYQFKNDVPITRKEADSIFQDNLRLVRFKWSGLYFFAVRTFGWMYGKWKVK